MYRLTLYLEKYPPLPFDFLAGFGSVKLWTEVLVSFLAISWGHYEAITLWKVVSADAISSAYVDIGGRGFLHSTCLLLNLDKQWVSCCGYPNSYTTGF